MDGGSPGGRDTGVPLVQGANIGAAVNVMAGSSLPSADSNTPSDAFNRGDQVYERGPSVRTHGPQQQHNNNSTSSNNNIQALTTSPQSGFTRDGEWVTGQDHERQRALGMLVGCEDGFHLHPVDTHCPHDHRVPTWTLTDNESETELDCISPGVTVRGQPGSATTASVTMMSRTLPSLPPLTPPLWSVGGGGSGERTTVLPGSTMMSRSFPTLPATPLANEPMAHQIRRIQMPYIEQLQRQYEEQLERQRSILAQSHLGGEGEEEQDLEDEEGFTPPLPDSSRVMLASSVPMSRQPASGVDNGWRQLQQQASSLHPQLPAMVPQRSTLPHPFELTSSPPSSSFASPVVPESHRLQGSNTLYMDYEGGVLRPQERWRRGDDEMPGR